MEHCSSNGQCHIRSRQGGSGLDPLGYQGWQAPEIAVPDPELLQMLTVF